MSPKTRHGQRYFYSLFSYLPEGEGLPPPPEFRESSPEKRAKIAGQVVGKIPLDAARMLARFFARLYLPGATPLSRREKKKLLGSPEEVAYAGPDGLVILAGSVRRKPKHAPRDTPIGDIDLVVVGPRFPEPDPEDLEAAAERGIELEWVSGGERMRTYRFRARHQATPWDVQINLMRATPEEMGATLLYATGPGGFNAMMRTKAKRVGLKLNRYGIFEAASGTKLAGQTEASIFEVMGKRFKAPTERGEEKARVRKPAPGKPPPPKPKPQPKPLKPPSDRVIRTQAKRARQRFFDAESKGLNPFQATLGRIRAMTRPEKMLGTAAFLRALKEERPRSGAEIGDLIAALDRHLEEVQLSPPSESAGRGYYAPAPAGEEPGPLVAAMPGVLLAKKWAGKEDVTCYWMSEKLDGVRAIWDGERFWSRNWKPFNAPDWFRKLMPAGVVLDGELWAGRGKFAETISAVRRKVPNDPQWKGIQYLVFDLPTMQAPFEARMKKLAQVTRRGKKHLQMVPQKLCVGEKDLAAFHRKISSAGGEGVMLRRAGSPYEGKRSSTLLKIKEFHDQEARILGHEKGLGKHLGRLGAYRAELLSSGAQFRVGTGLSDTHRERPLPVGSIITVRYQELTPAGIPRFPTFVAARDYE